MILSLFYALLLAFWFSVSAHTTGTAWRASPTNTARVGRAALLAQVEPTPGPATAPIVRWLWNFGDPSTGRDNISTEQNPTHQFSHAKVYTVTLTVWDSNGNSDTVTRYVTVAR